MGGTEVDRQPACTIKGTLTQTETQVVQPFFIHVTRTFRNKAGKYTFLYSTIVFGSNLNCTYTHTLHMVDVIFSMALCSILLTI